MVSSMQTSLSGIRAAIDRQDLSARNMANVNSDGYKSYTARSVEGEKGGVKVETGRDDSEGSLYAKGDGTLAESSNVDVARELTYQISAGHQMGANVVALKTADKMIGTLLDIMA